MIDLRINCIECGKELDGISKNCGGQIDTCDDCFHFYQGPLAKKECFRATVG